MVEADKGFNFSHVDDSFVCQKKNHFQVLCLVCSGRRERRGERRMCGREEQREGRGTKRREVSACRRRWTGRMWHGEMMERGDEPLCV